MKAIGLDSYGGPEVLHPIDLPDRHAGPGEVRIQVSAAAVAPVDSMLRTGLLSGAYAGLKPPFVPGMEVAGVVDELGEGVEVASELTLGERVVGFVDTGGTHGGYSDHVVLPAASVTPAPAGSTDAEAASFLNNALTARNALDALALPANSTLVVTGAAGSVGGYLTELGAFEGLRVIGIASAGDEELVRRVRVCGPRRRCCRTGSRAGSGGRGCGRRFGAAGRRDRAGDPRRWPDRPVPAMERPA